MIVKRSKVINYTESRDNNGLSTTTISPDESYMYLGIDENVAYVGGVTKARMTKEHTFKFRKIWNSETSALFAVLALVRIFGILSGIFDGISDIIIKTRNVLSTTGSSVLKITLVRVM